MRTISHILLFSMLLFSCNKEEELPKPVVKTSSGIVVNASGVTLQGTIENLGETQLLERGFVWNTEGDPTIDKSIQKSLGRGDEEVFTTTIASGVFENTTYFVKAYVKYSEGTAYGEDVSFVGLGDEPMKLVDFSAKEASWNDLITFTGKI